MFSRARTVPKRLDLDGRFQVDHVSRAEGWPSHSDFYVTFTGLSVKTELAADQMYALPVVLPQAAEWLNAELMRRLSTGADVWMFVAARAGDLPYL